MHFKEIMTREEKLRAKAIFLRTLKGNFVLGLFRSIIYLAVFMLSLKLISVSRYTHNRLYFMVGWGILPIPIWYHFAYSRVDKRIKPLKKLKRTDKQFSDTLMDEIVIDDEKITVNESLSVLHRDVKTAMFTKGFAAVIDRKKQPVIIKLSDEAQIRLYSLYIDKNIFRKKKNLFVVQDMAQKEYYIPEIEGQRKTVTRKRDRKIIGIAIVLAMVSLACSVMYVKDHLMTDEERNPVFEHTYTEGENLHDMLENTFAIGSGMEAVFDVYLDYADKTFDSYVKSTTSDSGATQLKVCYALGEDSVYIREITDNPKTKERKVVHGQFSGQERQIRELFECEYIQEEYPVISEYVFFIDDWKFTLKDSSIFTVNKEAVFYFEKNRAKFEHKDHEFTILLENGGEIGMLRIEKLFKDLESECRKPYGEQDINWESLETDILYNLRVGY